MKKLGIYLKRTAVILIVWIIVIPVAAVKSAWIILNGEVDDESFRQIVDRILAALED
jgi:hypothetical protein